MKNIPIRSIQSPRKEPPLSGSFNIRDIKKLMAGKDMVQELHRHDFFYVLALKKGMGNHTIDFTAHQIRNNSIFFLRPGQVHQLTLKAGSTGYLIEFKPDFYNPKDTVSHKVLRRASNKDLCRLNDTSFRKLNVILNSIFQEYTHHQENYHDVIKANLSIFFIELVRHRQNLDDPFKNANTYAQDRVEEFLDLLPGHIADHKQISHYAGLLNLSNYQLNAITKATLGKTCSELIDEFIVLEAKRYLLATSNQISQIAYQLGYEDASYFIRFFKKHTGYSPEAFRKNFE